MMDAEDQTKPLPKIEDMVFVHDNEAKVRDDIDEGLIVDETTSFCQKTDGKNWHCKNEAKQGQSFCEHHLSLLRSYNNNNSVSYNNNNTSSSKKAAASGAASTTGARRGKARAAAKRASSSSSATSNPYEFYYYSGFGPLWGKRRGDRNGEGSNNHRTKNEQLKGIENSTITEAEEANEGANQNTSSTSRSSSSSQMDNEEFDYRVDDDEEDEDDELEEDANINGDSGKKRMRKPVKARSLKSLM